MIVEIVIQDPEPIAQTGEPVFFKRREPQESDLSALSDLRKIYDLIRMLDAEGYPRAFVETAGAGLNSATPCFARATSKPK